MQISYLNMQNLEWCLADLKSTGKNTIETVEKSLTDMFIRLVRIYPCLLTQAYMVSVKKLTPHCCCSHDIFAYHLEVFHKINVWLFIR